MNRRGYQLRRWPETPLFEAIARRWCEDHSFLLMDLIWRACDRIRDNELKTMPVVATDEAKEESLNNLVCLRIQELKSGDAPFAVVHQPPEQFHRKTRNAQSPCPDVGFVWYANPNCVWPIEGKVLNSPTDVEAYAGEMNNFLTGRYATFSREAALLAYLIEGRPDETLRNIAKRIRKRPYSHPKLPNRPHQITKHRRMEIAARKAEDFYCHHLVLFVGSVE